MYVARLDTDRVSFGTEDLRRYLKETYQVGTAKHYPAVWSWEAFDQVNYDRGDCPHAEKACEQVFSLPVFPTTSADDLAYIAWAIKESIAALL